MATTNTDRDPWNGDDRMRWDGWWYRMRWDDMYCHCDVVNVYAHCVLHTVMYVHHSRYDWWIWTTVWDMRENMNRNSAGHMSIPYDRSRDQAQLWPRNCNFKPFLSRSQSILIRLTSFLNHWMQITLLHYMGKWHNSIIIHDWQRWT
jgi:hypothetical protein